MKFSKIRVIFTTVFVFSSISEIALAQNPYPLGFRSDFLTGCLFGAEPDFTNESDINLKLKSCLCMLEKIEQNYSLEEILEISQQQPPNAEYQRFIDKTAPSCL